MGCTVFRDSAALHGRLQCCRVTVLSIDFWSFPSRESSCKISAQSVEKWLRYTGCPKKSVPWFSGIFRNLPRLILTISKHIGIAHDVTGQKMPIKADFLFSFKRFSLLCSRDLHCTEANIFLANLSFHYLSATTDGKYWEATKNSNLMNFTFIGAKIFASV